MKDPGLTEKQSHRWQAVATVPEKKFEEHIAETKEKKKELTTAGVLRMAKSQQRAVVTGSGSLQTQ